MFGDVVLARKDAPASYHLAVTVDDAAQGITDVVRGEDLFAATHVHRLLQALLGLPTPRYHHHPLVTDAAGRRLAKRDRALTLEEMRRAGTDPAALRSEEHTSELQSLMRISYAVFCLKKKNKQHTRIHTIHKQTHHTYII